MNTTELPPGVVAALIACDLPLTCLELYAELQATRRSADAALLEYVQRRGRGTDVGSTLLLTPSPPPVTAAPTLDATAVLDFLRKNGCSDEADSAAMKLAGVAPEVPKPTPPPAASSSSATAALAEAWEVNLKLEARLTHVIRTLGDRLPTVIESVHSDRKDNAVPLILTAVEFHTVSTVRRSLLYHLLHMYRRPTAEQRTALLASLRTLSESLRAATGVGSSRIEDEVVAELLQLRDHRYAEMRCLCAAAPLVFHGLIGPNMAAYLVIHVAIALSSDSSSTVRTQVASTMAACAKALRGSSGDELMHTVVRLALDSKPPVVAALNAVMPEVLTTFAAADKLFGAMVPIIVAAMMQLDAEGSVNGEPSTPYFELLVALLHQTIKVGLASHAKGDTVLTVDSVRDLVRSVWRACLVDSSDRMRERLAIALSAATGALAGALKAEIFASFDAELERAEGDGTLRRRWLSTALIHHAFTSQDLTGILTLIARQQAPWIDDDDTAMCVSTLARALGLGGVASLAVTNALLVLVTSPVASDIAPIALRTFELAAPSIRESQAVTGVWPVLAALIDRTGAQAADTPRFTEAVRVAFSLSGHPSFLTLLDMLFPCVFDAIGLQLSSDESIAVLNALAKHILRLPTQHRDKHAIPHLCRVCQELCQDRPAADPTRKALVVRATLDVFAALTACPSLGFHALNVSLVPSLKSIAKDCEMDPEFKAMHAAVLKTLLTLEARAKPRQAMSFFDKVKHELASIGK